MNTRLAHEVPVGERPGVVVGVDGSDASLAAFAHGAWEADRRGLPLYLVHCHDVPAAFAVLGLVPDPAAAEGPALAAAQRLADLAEQARAAYPQLVVETAVVAAHPGAALVRASRHAALVVIGSRGLGGFAGLLLGSVGTQLSAHSAAPVIVIRDGRADGEDGPGTPTTAELGSAPAPLPVVVGVDGVPDSEAAISFAFEEAAARRASVVAVYAWWMLPVSRLQPAGVRPFDLSVEPDLQRAEEEARRLLAEATAGAREEYPDVPVTLLPAHAMNPVVALLETSANTAQPRSGEGRAASSAAAQRIPAAEPRSGEGRAASSAAAQRIPAGLLVVSRHGGNALTRLIFSSIGDVAVREASCPVAVVPETSAQDGGGGAAQRRGWGTAGSRRHGGRRGADATGTGH